MTRLQQHERRKRIVKCVKRGEPIYRICAQEMVSRSLVNKIINAAFRTVLVKK